MDRRLSSDSEYKEARKGRAHLVKYQMMWKKCYSMDNNIYTRFDKHERENEKEKKESNR